MLIALVPPHLQFFGFFDRVFQKIFPETWTIGLLQGQCYLSISSPFKRTFFRDNRLLEFDIFSIIHFDIVLTLVAVCLHPNAIFLNQNFSFERLSAVRSVHLAVKSNLYKRIGRALRPVHDRFNLRELPISLTLLDLKHEVVL